MLRVDQAALGPAVRAGFTTRQGGVSTGDFAGLNLALHVGDDPVGVRGNRALLERWAEAPVQYLDQVHGCVVAVAPPDRPGDPGPRADAVISSSPKVAVAVLVADCVPVLLADSAAGLVAAVHAGRAGMVGGVLQAAVRAMTEAGARPERIVAALGPAAGGCCYEVGPALRDEVCALVPAAWATTTWGTASVDLRAGCTAILTGLGVRGVSTVGGCTIEDDRRYSYRRAGRHPQHPGRTGRFAGVIRLLP